MSTVKNAPPGQGSAYLLEVPASIVKPMVARIPLYSLSDFPITAAMTLYIPPARLRNPDPTPVAMFYSVK